MGWAHRISEAGSDESGGRWHPICRSVRAPTFSTLLPPQPTRGQRMFNRMDLIRGGFRGRLSNPPRAGRPEQTTQCTASRQKTGGGSRSVPPPQRPPTWPRAGLSSRQAHPQSMRGGSRSSMLCTVHTYIPRAPSRAGPADGRREAAPPRPATSPPPPHRPRRLAVSRRPRRLAVPRRPRRLAASRRPRRLPAGASAPAPPPPPPPTPTGNATDPHHRCRR